MRTGDGRAALPRSRRPPSSDGTVSLPQEMPLPRNAAVDVHALESDPALVDSLALEDLPVVLEWCAVEHGRLAVVERLAHARLRRELSDFMRATEGLLTARQAGRRLGVSADYVRGHGESLGIAVHLDGVVRYDPAAVAGLRRARRRDEPPRD